MSFTEMMGSSRGPAMIGTVIGLIALVGFGTLYLFVFDEGLQGGGRTIQSLIAEQAREIDQTKSQIQTLTREISVEPTRKADALDLMKRKINTSTVLKNIEELKGGVLSLNESIQEKERNFSAYKDEYRAYVRGKAKGTTLAELKTADGNVYHQVEVREVTAIGMQIRYDGGFKRLAFEDLPEKMQDFYQYDPAQREDAIAAESEARDKHDAAADAANEAAEQQMSAQRESNAAKDKDKMVAQISSKEAQIRSWENEVSSLEQEKSKAASEASSAKAAGHVHIDRTSAIASRIRGKRNQIATLQAEINQLKVKVSPR